MKTPDYQLKLRAVIAFLKTLMRQRWEEQQKEKETALAETMP